MIEMIGGPDRDRTDDLFHAMEAVLAQIIDGTVLTSRHSRQNRRNGRYLRAKCGQNMTPSGRRAGLCGTSPKSFILSGTFVQQPAAQTPSEHSRTSCSEFS